MSTVQICNKYIKNLTIHFVWWWPPVFCDDRSRICCHFIKTGCEFIVEELCWRCHKVLADSQVCVTTFWFYVVMSISERWIYSSRAIGGSGTCWLLVCVQYTTVPSMTYGSQLSTDQQQTRTGFSDSPTTTQPFTFRILLVTSLCIIKFQYT